MSRIVVMETLRSAASVAGIPAEAVFDRTAGDNLTLSRPRMEIQWLKEKFSRTGRKLGVRRHPEERILKRELYSVELPVVAQVFAENQEWLDSFTDSFVGALPAGVTDAKGNWVRIRVDEAELQRPADTRIGNNVIQVFKKTDKLFYLSFIWRVTTEDRVPWIRDITINTTLEA